MSLKSVASPTPGQINGIIMPNRNSFAFIGDSRAIAMFTDGVFPSTGHYKTNMWWCTANALMGQPMKLVYNGGISGDRSDQYLVNLPAALASRAGWLVIHGVVNDISQGANGDTAATIWARIKSAAQQALNIGMNVIIVGEPGSTGLSGATALGMVFAFNEYAREFCEWTPGAYYFDLPSAIVDPVNSTSSAIAFLASYSSDGTHLNSYGHWFAGQAFKSFISPLIAPIYPSIICATEVAANGNLQQISNPLFLTTTGGTANAGITAGSGTPAGYTVSRSGSTTATIATATAPADLDGLTHGNAVTFTITFANAGEYVEINSGTTLGNYTGGDIVDSGCTVNVSAGSTNLASTQLYTNYGTVSNPVGDMAPIGTNIALPNVAMTNLTLRSVPFVIPNGITWAFWAFRAYAAGAGSATVKISRPWMRRRFAI